MDFFTLDSLAEGLPGVCDTAEHSQCQQNEVLLLTVQSWARGSELPPGDSQPPPTGNDQPFPRHHLPDQESWSHCGGGGGVLFKIYFQLKDHRFTELCWFLPNVSMNQP